MKQKYLLALSVFLLVVAALGDTAGAATTLTFKTGEALATRGVRVTLNTTASTVVTAGAADEDIGVTLAPAVASSIVAVNMASDGEVTDYIASGAITAGADVYPAASGKVSATVAGKRLGKAVIASSSDGDVIRVLKLAPAADRVILTFQMTAASVDHNVFVADRAYSVVSVKEIHSVVGSTSAAVSLRKITDTSAPGASAGSTVKELATAAFDLTATINTTQTATLSATASDYTLAAGNRICTDFSGTLTGLVGVVVIELKAK